ncbi:MAG: hypothetical protein HY259_02530 [Chloroflexi bacterium]|nr:hypothetical protein [Chloroflexota bacterium]
MNPQPPNLSRDPIGLCGQCHYCRLVKNARGSQFYLCQFSEIDPRYARYPRLPVLRCEAFAPEPPGQAVSQ